MEKMPDYTKDRIDAYVSDGVPPGGFLQAVLANDLREAFGRADENNRGAMFDIVSYCWNKIPGECWGSPEKVKAWIERKDDVRDISAGAAGEGKAG